MVSSLVGFVTALASHQQSVMNAMFADEFTGTDIERQQSLNTVVMSTSSLSNCIQDVLAQRVTELSTLKQLRIDSGNKIPSDTPSHTFSKQVKMRQRWDGREGSSGQLLHPLQHLWHCWYRSAAFGAFRFPAEQDKGRVSRELSPVVSSGAVELSRGQGANGRPRMKPPAICTP